MISEVGKLYIADQDGNYHEFGGIKEINIELDESVDAMEELTSSDYWPYPTYGDMLFKL